MKALAKLVMMLAVLAICMPAYGQEEAYILIYARTIDFWLAELTDGDWDGDDEHITEFLVLELLCDSETGEILDILNAQIIEYWRDGRDKWYDQDGERYDIESFELDGEVIWVLEYIYSEENGASNNEMIMIRGKAGKMNIGLGRDEKRDVARILKGCRLMSFSNLPFGYARKEMSTIKWRLQQRWTRLANDPDECDGDFGCAIYDIVKDWLERRGYVEP